MIIIGRHINGITLNPMEFISDDNGVIKIFNNEEEAKEFLVDNDIDLGVIDNGIYLIEEECYE